MHATVKMVFMLALLIASMHAQTEKKAFWLSAGTLTAATMADGISTQQMISRGFREEWSPELYGRKPSNLRFYSVSLAMEGTAMLISHKLISSHHKYLKPLGWGLMAWRVDVRASSAWHNSQLRP